MKKYFSCLFVLAALTGAVSGCGGDAPGPAAKVNIGPQGAMAIVNQDSNTLSLIDVATDQVVATAPLGRQPHHVATNPARKELWITLYKENRLQVLDSNTLQEIASVPLDKPSDDLTFDASGQRLYVSQGQGNSVSIVDAAARQVVGRVAVGRVPHGVKLRPDERELYVTNTADNTVSILSLGANPQQAATIRAGANPFEVTFNSDGSRAYISNFLGDSITVVDTATRSTAATIRSGPQPAMLSFVPGAQGDLLWVAATGGREVWAIDPATRKLVQRIPVGTGAHGVWPTPGGKVYVTNTSDGTVTVVDAATMTVRATIGAGSNPNGLTFIPPPQ